MVEEKSGRADIRAWIEPIPETAPVSWCLPAYGGRVVVRGYDTYRSRLGPFPGSSRWMVDSTFVPLTSSLSDRTEGPHGNVFPGDCVIFFGSDSGRPEAHLWYPQRVIHTETNSSGWQQVWAIRDTSELPETQTDRATTELPGWMRTSDPLRGPGRRKALELFGLNVDCPACGGRGKPILYGMPAGPPGPHIAIGGCDMHRDNPTYSCRCGAHWRVERNGAVVFTQPMTAEWWPAPFE